MLSSTTQRKRRVTAQMTSHRIELKLFGVQSAAGNRVVIVFAGVKEEFWFPKNQEPFRTPNNTPLDPADQQVLWKLARAICSASEAGYTNTPDRKKRKTVAPVPITNRQRIRQETHVMAARKTMLYQLFVAPIDKLPYFQIQSFTGQEICMRVGDTKHHVVFNSKHGHGRLRPTGYRLSLRWWSFICCFGDMLLAAAQTGYKSANPAAKQRSVSNPTHRCDPRQYTWPM
ncbi:MAG: hypothetical protein ACI9SY_000452 [Candidatus Paceibacteria bacterium]|jgi:hypothetical protein